MIKELIKDMDVFFRENNPQSYDFRISALKGLKEGLQQYENHLFEGVYKDFGKPQFEAFASELLMIYNEIDYFIKRLKGWMKPKKVSGGLSNFPSKGLIQRDAYGRVLIIAPWNYPIQLSLLPLVGALAGGNTAIIKPSELTPETSKVIKKLIEAVFPPQQVAVILGDVNTSKALLAEPFDLIFFTGSTAVGRSIMAQAADHLTPVILELGGKSPCLVDHTAKIDLAAKRVAWGKFLNGGQTCIAPDYCLVDERVMTPFLEALEKWVKVFYYNGNQISGDYVQIINDGHYHRLNQMLDNGTLVFGGGLNPEKRIIEPTVMIDVDLNSKVMNEEIFGPILPVVGINSVEEGIGFMNERSKPLAFYYFTEASNPYYVIDRVPSGGACINDTIMHVASEKMPFGGVGSSGMGAYHGYSSFKAFTHERSVLVKSTKVDLDLKYPPYTGKLERIRKLLRK